MIATANTKLTQEVIEQCAMCQLVGLVGLVGTPQRRIADPQNVPSLLEMTLVEVFSRYLFPRMECVE